MAHYEVNIELVVGTARLPRQLDLDVLRENLDGHFKVYDKQPGLNHRFEEDGLLATFHRGSAEDGASYIVRAYDGENNTELAYEHHNRILDELVKIGVITEEEREDVELDIYNHVGNTALNINLALASVAIGLGLKNTEYETEVFPSVIYYGPYPCVALIFNSGRVVIPGGKTRDEVKETLEGLLTELYEVFPSQFDEENTVEIL